MHYSGLQNDLNILIANVLDVWAKIDPKRIFDKPKIHLITHTPDDIRRFGPSPLFATEIFECFNAVFRLCSVLSNHQAPSRDIALTFRGLDRFKHHTSGGWWFSEDTQAWVQAGSKIRSYFQSPAIQRRLGWSETRTQKLSERGTKHFKLEDVSDYDYSLGTIRTLKKSVCTEWKATKSADFGVTEPQVLDLDGNLLEGCRSWTQGKHVVSQVGDICKPGYWIFFKSRDGISRHGELERNRVNNENCSAHLHVRLC